MSPQQTRFAVPRLGKEEAGLILATLVEPVVIQAIGPDFDRQLLIPRWMPKDAKRPSAMGRKMAEWLVGKACLVCGGTKKVQAHHMLPWHIWPQWGMEPRLWAPLCRGNAEIDCHALCGHAGNTRGICLHVVEFAGLLNKAICMNRELIRVLDSLEE